MASKQSASALYDVCSYVEQVQKACFHACGTQAVSEPVAYSTCIDSASAVQ